MSDYKIVHMTPQHIEIMIRLRVYFRPFDDCSDIYTQEIKFPQELRVGETVTSPNNYVKIESGANIKLKQIGDNMFICTKWHDQAQAPANILIENVADAKYNIIAGVVENVPAQEKREILCDIFMYNILHNILQGKYLSISVSRRELIIYNWMYLTIFRQKFKKYIVHNGCIFNNNFTLRRVTKFTDCTVICC